MFDLSSMGIEADTLQNGRLPTCKVNNTILLYDGDGACYKHSAGVKNLSTAQRRLEMDILETMFLAGAGSARVHLTPSGCHKNGRHLLLGVKPYQQNRANTRKPDLLEPLRASALFHFDDHPDITIVADPMLEADDTLMMDTYALSNTILVSPDKDLRITRTPQYIVNTGETLTLPDGDRYGYIKLFEWNSPSGAYRKKVVGKGTKFFLAQMLMGDTADNVKGILKYNGKLCGEMAALAALENVGCEHDAVNRVLTAYREIDQNPIPEAEAMWLLRHPHDSAYAYFLEHDLLSENKAYLEHCYNERKWFMTKEEYDEKYAG